MDIKVGDYIRLKDGYIRKYIKRSLDNHIILDEVYEGFKYLTSIEEKEEIVKHSPNIIDLIEVGDYVNGYLVYEKLSEDCDVLVVHKGGLSYLFPVDIKSIVTKEMMKSIEYRIN